MAELEAIVSRLREADPMRAELRAPQISAGVIEVRRKRRRSRRRIAFGAAIVLSASTAVAATRLYMSSLEAPMIAREQPVIAPPAVVVEPDLEITPPPVEEPVKRPAPRVRKPAAEPRPPVIVAEEPFSLDDAIRELARLRSLGEYERAAAHLEALLARALDPRAEEVLSFELGAILEKQIADRERACKQWLAHAARFPSGRYEQDVRRSLERLSCGH